MDSPYIFVVLMILSTLGVILFLKSKVNSEADLHMYRFGNRGKAGQFDLLTQYFFNSKIPFKRKLKILIIGVLAVLFLLLIPLVYFFLIINTESI
jgi:hypothetical protein